MHKYILLFILLSSSAFSAATAEPPATAARFARCPSLGSLHLQATEFYGPFARKILT